MDPTQQQDDLATAADALRQLLPDALKGMPDGGDSPDENEAEASKGEDPTEDDAKAGDPTEDDCKAPDGADEAAKTADAAEAAPVVPAPAAVGGDASLLEIGKALGRLDGLEERVITAVTTRVVAEITKSFNGRFDVVEAAAKAAVSGVTELGKAAGWTPAAHPAGPGLAAGTLPTQPGAGDRFKSPDDEVAAPEKFSEEELLKGMWHKNEKGKTLNPRFLDFYREHGQWPGDEDQRAALDAHVRAANETKTTK